MIKLLIEDYCHNCPEFYPEMIGGDAYYYGSEMVYVNDRVVRCVSYERCCMIRKHLEKFK